MRQFYYKIEIDNPGQEKKEAIGSFNTDMVVRTMEFENRVAVLLNDFREMVQTVPVLNKQGKPSGVKDRREVVNSEIFLNAEDSARFRRLVEVGA